MFYSIDRLEGECAVLIADETGQQLQIPRADLPPEAGEGSLLRCENGSYIYDAEATARRRREFFERTRNLSKK